MALDNLINKPTCWRLHEKGLSFPLRSEGGALCHVCHSSRSCQRWKEAQCQGSLLLSHKQNSSFVLVNFGKHLVCRWYDVCRLEIFGQKWHPLENEWKNDWWCTEGCFISTMCCVHTNATLFGGVGAEMKWSGWKQDATAASHIPVICFSEARDPCDLLREMFCGETASNRCPCQVINPQLLLPHNIILDGWRGLVWCVYSGPSGFNVLFRCHVSQSFPAF